MKENEIIEYIKQLVDNRLLDLESYITRSQRDKKTSLEYYNELIEERKKCRSTSEWLEKAIEVGIL